MSMKSRYEFTKNKYKDYIVLIRKNNTLYYFDQDKKILDYIDFKDKIYKIRKRNINYLILDDLDIIEINKYNKNNYNKYLLSSYLKDILNEIRKSYKKYL